MDRVVITALFILTHCQAQDGSEALYNQPESDIDELLGEEDGDGVSSAHAVTELNPFTFNHHVLRSFDTVWLIKFYSSRCPHCINMVEAFKRAAKEIEKDDIAHTNGQQKGSSGRLRLQVGAMNGEVFSGFASAYGVSGWPTVLAFMPARLLKQMTKEEVKARKHPRPMTGLGGWESIVAFGQSMLSEARNLRTRADAGRADPRHSKLCPKLWLNETWTFAHGRHASSGGAGVHVLYLSDVAEPEPPEWLSYLAIKLKKGSSKRAALAYLPAPDAEAVASGLQVELTRLPLVVVMGQVEDLTDEDEKEGTSDGDDDGDGDGDGGDESEGKSDNDDKVGIQGSINDDNGEAASSTSTAGLVVKRSSLHFVTYTKRVLCSTAAAADDASADCERKRREGLQEFIETFAKHPDVFATRQVPLQALPRPSGLIAATGKALKLTSQNEDERCLALHRNPRQKKTCLVLVLGGGNRVAIRSQRTLASTIARRYARDPFVVSYVYFAEQPEFVHAFGIGNGASDLDEPEFLDASAAAVQRGPALIALKTHKNAKRIRFATLKLDRLDSSECADAQRTKAESFVDGVLGGNVRFTRLGNGTLPRLIEELLDVLPSDPATGGGNGTLHM